MKTDNPKNSYICMFREVRHFHPAWVLTLVHKYVRPQNGRDKSIFLVKIRQFFLTSKKFNILCLVLWFFLRNSNKRGTKCHSYTKSRKIDVFEQEIWFCYNSRHKQCSKMMPDPLGRFRGGHAHVTSPYGR